MMHLSLRQYVSRASAPSFRAVSTSSVCRRDVVAEIEQQVKGNKCVVYIRGDRSTPHCKFSRAVVDALDSVGKCQSNSLLTCRRG